VQGILVAVDRDYACAAFGQQADGRASDDSGRTSDDGNPAVEANSIGHRHSPFAHIPVIAGFGKSAPAASLVARLFHL
jgi:hypothetical protein